MLDVALNDNASNSDRSTSDCVMRIFYFPKLLFKVFFFASIAVTHVYALE